MYRNCYRFALTLLFIVTIMTTSWVATASPTIVTSIPPFYNITAAITKGVTTPQLLIQANQSPHNFNLKPSDILALNQADLIFWGGLNLESYLEKYIKDHPANYSIEQIPGLQILKPRHKPHEHEHDDHHHSTSLDPHLWLSPANAMKIATFMVKILRQIDPSNQSTYQSNLEKFKDKLHRTDQQIKLQLENISKQSYLVSHDAFQYFERAYQLKPMGAITQSPEIPPSVTNIARLQEYIKDNQVQCIFYEPQFKPKILDTLKQSKNAKYIKLQVLDPLGQEEDLGPDGYFQLLQKLGNSFSQCLQVKTN